MNQQEPRKEDGMDLLFRALVTGDSSNAILGQEADGQKSFVSSTTLPTDMREAKAVLEAAGVKFLGVVEDDPIFQYVELPNGWKKVATSHSMHSDLVDDKGRKRAGIFYKAAFYDRSAHLSVNRRYGTSIDYDRLEKEKVAVATVTDGNDVIFTAEPVKFEEDKARYDAQDEARALAVAWLNEHFPNWEDASAYWD
jgi:hypothetical protein